MATEEASSDQRQRSDRTLAIGFLLVVAAAMIGWVYGIIRGAIAVTVWLLG